MIVTAIVSTNRFLQNLSELIKSVDSESDATASVNTEPSVEVSASVSTDTASPVAAVPSTGATMNVTLNRESGKPNISLSTSSSEKLPSVYQAGGGQQGSVDVTGSVRSASNSRGSAASGPDRDSTASRMVPDDERVVENPETSMNSTKPLKWVSAAEARASKGKVAEPGMHRH